MYIQEEILHSENYSLKYYTNDMFWFKTIKRNDQYDGTEYHHNITDVHMCENVYIYLTILFIDLNFTPTEETHTMLDINH